MIPSLPIEESYSNRHESAKWCGLNVTDDEQFAAYLKGTVKQRVFDEEAHETFAAELKSLATTGMATNFIEELLQEVQPTPGWAIGEALAECLLADDEKREVCWPWNTARDRKTPKASLPGADLVGFCKEGDKVVLLFGEVKTSHDSKTPPNVMYGRSGMTWQLEAEATCLCIQCTLLKWLRFRCTTPEHKEMYRNAVGRYVKSGGKDFLLVGALLRDTEPNELDVRSRAVSLAGELPAPTRIEIKAWYLPIRIEVWTDLLNGGSS